MARAELGTKRLCGECGAKYYDLGKSPIVCPKCEAVFEVVGATPKREPTRPEPVKAEPEETVETAETEDVEVVSLEDVEADESADVDVDDEDIAVVDDDTEIEDDDDDTFLEEDEDEDDDVSGILGSGLAGEDEDT